MPVSDYNRKFRGSLCIGNLRLGSEHPIALQSMTRSDTRDVKATIGECISAFEAGAELMRISVPDKASLEALRQIRDGLREAGFHQPLAADIHYRPELAHGAARIIEKIRINPSNFIPPQSPGFDEKALPHQAKDQELLRRKLKDLVDICRDRGTAIRIGVNAGSLPAGMVSGHAPTHEQVAKAALNYVEVFESLDFDRIVISLKSANPAETLAACRLFQEKMAVHGRTYPMHIGLTEAGSGIAGRVKSALAIMGLLREGIGDTLRVSLTESPEAEVAFGKSILQHLRANECLSGTVPEICPDHSGKLSIHSDANDEDGLVAEAVNQYLHAEACCSAEDEPAIGDIFINCRESMKKTALEVAAHLLQLMGVRSTQTDFVSCPACARVQMDMESLCREIKERFRGHPGLRIAIMGCMVNGPGEMAAADFGFIAAGKDRLNLYRGSHLLKKHLQVPEAIRFLENVLGGTATDKS